MNPIVIDVEASAFGRGSYPIEIGVAMPEHTTHCYLIRPENDWQRWDEEAASIHNLSRETLIAHGRDVGDVARELNSLLKGQHVYSDAWGFDSSWIALLFHRAGVTQEFRLRALDTLMEEPDLIQWAQTRDDICEAMNLTRHRASADALITQLTYLRLKHGKDFELPDYGLLNLPEEELCFI